VVARHPFTAELPGAAELSAARSLGTVAADMRRILQAAGLVAIGGVPVERPAAFTAAVGCISPQPVAHTAAEAMDTDNVDGRIDAALAD
jgi:hypothetical protein